MIIIGLQSWNRLTGEEKKTEGFCYCLIGLPAKNKTHPLLQMGFKIIDSVIKLQLIQPCFL